MKAAGQDADSEAGGEDLLLLLYLAAGVTHGTHPALQNKMKQTSE